TTDYLQQCLAMSNAFIALRRKNGGLRFRIPSLRDIADAISKLKLSVKPLAFTISFSEKGQGV
ncbi:hypothetical protein MST14_23890, partial [Klebsiella pneumoniae]|uniref:hypothetical protein n=1 Tax=Klebsiella pneumoniae TaxID=573 RepID=UPI0033658650